MVPHGLWAQLKTKLGGSYVYRDLGPWVVLTQTGALLEVFHAMFGLVRSSPVTVGMQVASRLFMVWGIVEARPEVRSTLSCLVSWTFHSFFGFLHADPFPPLVHHDDLGVVSHRVHSICVLHVELVEH